MHLVCDSGLTAVIDKKMKYRSNRTVERDTSVCVCVVTFKMKTRFWELCKRQESQIPFQDMVYVFTPVHLE